MSFSFGAATTTAASTFGTTTPSTGFAFGSGDAAKQGLFGSNNAENKPAFNFASPSGGGFAFGAAKTTAATSSIFSTPTTTSTGSAFGASKPVAFGGFTSPPNQTVGSPGFGQMGQSSPQNLSFDMISKPLQQQQPPSTFGSATPQATTGFGFGYAPLTTGSGAAQPSTGFGAQTTSSFGTATTNANVGFATSPPTAGFGFSTPASGFSAPQASAATTTTAATTQPAQSFLGSSPGFGQSAFGSKPGSAFSFGGGNTAAPAFGAATTTSTTAPAFGSNTASPAKPTFALPGQQPPAQPGLNFGTSTATTGATGQNTGLTSGLNFGAQPTTSAAPTFDFKQPASTANKLSFGSPVTSTPAAPSAGLNFGQAPTSQPTQQTNLNFAATSQPSLNFGTAATSAPQTSLNFGTATTSSGVTKPATTTTGMFGTSQAQTAFPKASLSIAPTSAPSTTQATSTGLNFGTSTTAAGLNFGTATTAASTIQPGFGLTGTSGSSILGFGKPITAVASSAASTTAPSGITALGKTTATTTMASLTTATTTTAAAPPQMITSISFAQLEESINKWTLELEEQEKTFINQATQINAWDRLLIANGEKIVELNDAVQSVKNEQQSLEHELDFVLAQQKELEDLLAPMEKQLSEETVERLRDPEREHMYSLAENLDTQLRQMSEDLKEVIEHLNETNRSQDSNDPIVQIGRILNAHMSSMQWIDNSIAQISTKLDQLKATHDTLRRDNERSYQLTYN